MWQALRLALAGIFALALWHKLADPSRFAATIADYRLLPQALAWPAAVAVIGAESAAAAMLLLELATPFAAALSAGLLATYLAAIVVNLLRGRTSIDCGCFGPAGAGRQNLSWWLVPRNALLIAVAILLAIADAGPRALGWLDYTSIAATVATTLILYLGGDQLIANQAQLRKAHS